MPRPIKRTGLFLCPEGVKSYNCRCLLSGRQNMSGGLRAQTFLEGEKILVKNMWFYGLSKKLYERLSDDEYVFFASGDFLGGSLKHTSKNCYKLCFLHRDKGAVTLSCYSKRSAAEQVSRLYGRVSV